MNVRKAIGFVGRLVFDRGMRDPYEAIHENLAIREALAEALPNEADRITSYLRIPVVIKGFDANFVQNYYPLSLLPGEDPLAFYCRHAEEPWCFPTEGAVEEEAVVVRKSTLFDGESVLMLMAPEAKLDPARYYCTEAYRLSIAPSDRFDAAAYLIQNPDVAEANVNPLLHYELHGRVEGRPAPSRTDLKQQPALFSLAKLLSPESRRPDNRQILVNCNQGGLMNRLIPMLSLVDHSERLGIRPAVWWTPNSHCAARLPDLFDTGSTGLGVMEMKELSTRTYSVWINRIEGDGTPPLDSSTIASLAMIHSVTPWGTQDAPVTSYQRIAELFERLPLSSPIQKKLKQFDSTDFSRTIGLHIRRPYPNGIFAEQEQAKFDLSLDAYVRFIEWVRQVYPTFDAVLLCTNSDEVEPYLVKRLGNVFAFAKESIDNTSEAVAVQDALVDLKLMARCPIIISQSTTSFGFFASVIGNGRLLSIKHEKDNRAEFIISLYGTRVKDVTADDNGASVVQDTFKIPLINSS